MPMNAKRTAMKATAAEGVAKSRGVGYQKSVLRVVYCTLAARTSCIDPPKTMMTLWFAMSFGFLTRSAASVRWNKAKLRIIAFADMMAIFASVGASSVVRCSCDNRRRGLGVPHAKMSLLNSATLNSTSVIRLMTNGALSSVYQH
jgi:hypothetical protein